MKVSIIIPVFNEEAILKKSVTKLINKLNNHIKVNWEILLIENGSTDSTKKIALELSEKYKQVKVFSLKSSSYGKALRFGIKKSTGEILVIFNIDFWDVEFLVKGLVLVKSCDIVNASKTLISSRDNRPFFRRQMTYWFNALLRIIYNFPGTDTHGLKIMRSSSIQSLLHSCYPLNELYDTQLILHACKKGLIYTELPVEVIEIRPSRYFNFSRFLRLVHDLITVFKYRYL